MTRTRLVVAMLAVALLIGATAGPSGADTVAGAQFMAGPTTGLVDGQPILVTGTGFAPDTTVHFYECRIISGCVALDQSAVTDGAGRLATIAHARRGLDDSGTPVDCTVTQCFLAVSSSTTDAHAAFQDMTPGTGEVWLSFAPRATVTVVPNRRLADGQAVTVEGRGLVPGQTISVLECTSSPCTYALPGSGVADRGRSGLDPDDRPPMDLRLGGEQP